MRMKTPLIITSIALMALTACTNNVENVDSKADKKALTNLNEKSAMPIVKEPITLKFFAGRTAQSAKDWNNVLIFNKYEKMTNVDIKWEMVPDTSLEEKRNLALVGGNLPDAFHTASFPATEILKYGEQGVFIKLNDLIDKYAPNLKKIMKENPEVKNAITFPNGNIYSFPTIISEDFTSMLLGPRPWINKEWLEKLGMKMPETIEEYYEYLKAVKEKDPNGNGKADEIPFGSYSIGMLTRWLNGSFGLVNRGYASPFVDMNPKENKLRFIQTSKEYKEMLQYVHKLYKEGLIEKNIFSKDTSQFLANATQGLYGSTVSHSPKELFGADKYTGGSALEGPFGDKLITGRIPSVASMDGFVITSANKNPEATVKWMDYFYSDEGSKLFLMGVEGETFEKAPNGELRYLDKITHSSEGLSFEQELAKYLTWPGGGYPGIVKEEFFKGLENAPDAREAARKLEPNIIKEVWPQFTYTVEENKTLTTVGADIEKYVTEMRDKFITGVVPFSEWDKYVKTIEKMGLKDYMKVKAEALKRYQKN
ncbi:MULTISPECIES: extracellular solute-binding protein [Bacillus]|uniref:extracellular solute-binding protein n=2 Tax=Bacillaceae TaxID=186817 RepID=UPI000B49C180|nr:MULTISPECIES: extracellular solute-binding protein [Bacillus]MEA1008996.1 extracellular solute-binding protein [Bacillus cereus]PGT17278.1 ABC transporter substrate-binding protein [Bacillus cereus]PGX09218.1 ABC transporter substrate-binding protein [Bacillus sp. AFS033286]